MPSYPDSVKSFTAKTAGQNIDPAHVNDIQDEVNAVEAGLLDGTARLNSSRSTLANLSVTGGSTLAGTLQSSNSTLASLSVTGGSTLAGTLQSSNSTVNALSVSSNSTFAFRPTMPPPDIVQAYLESTVALGSSANSTVSWTAQAFAINSSMHSTATNPTRLTPQSTGVYRLVAQVGLSSNSTSVQQLILQDSSGSQLGQLLHSSGAEAVRIQATAYKRFDVTGGFFVCRLALTGQSTLSLSSGVEATWCTLEKL